MSSAPVVSNSSPLIALEQIGQQDLLRLLYGKVLIPPAVAQETLRSVPRHDWLHEQPLAEPLPQRVARASIGEGEREAIALAQEVEAREVILDDDRGRRLALSLGLPVVGTIGVLVAAKEAGLIDAVRPHFEALVEVRFFLSPGLMRRALFLAGEESSGEH